MKRNPPSTHRAGTVGPHGLSRRELMGAALATGVVAVHGSTAQTAAAHAQPTGPLGHDGPIHERSALQLAADVREGRLRATEIVEALLTRIDTVNPKVNAITSTLADEAMATAREIDRDLAAGRPLGPLAGVPFTIKDNIDVEGSPTTQGIEELQAAIPGRDAPIVTRLERAGAIPLARTNMPDFGMRVHTESETHGITRNPWDPAVNVGGSSGGEGAALATGMSALGLGNDIGGSLRNPAHCCGIVALKPTFGRIPRSSDLSSAALLAGQLMAVDGPMARNVADLQIAYESIAGYDASDPWSMPVPLRLDRPRPLRVALVAEPSGGATDAVVADGVRRAGEALSNAGYTVEEIEPPDLAGTAKAWTDFITTDLDVARPQMMATMGEGGRRFLELAYQINQPLPRAGFSQVLLRRHALAAAWQTFQQRYPLIVGPVFTQQPFPVGYDLESIETARDVLVQLRFTVTANLLGLPSVAVPVGLADGLPLAVQIIGDRYLESLCLEAAGRIEAAFGTLTPIDPRSARRA